MPQGPSLAGFDAVLFDVDGTLVDSLETLVLGLGDTFERYAGIRPPSAEIREMIGMPLRDQIPLVTGTRPESEEMAEMTSYAISRFQAHKEHERIFPAALQTLAFCKERGQRTALVTSKNATELELFLRHFPGAAHVDATVCASDVTDPKPDPESAFLACERLSVAPLRAVMVGDSIYDMRCARGAGVATVAVAYGAATRDALLAEHPDLLFETPEALLEWATTSFLQTPCPARS